MDTFYLDPGDNRCFLVTSSGAQKLGSSIRLVEGAGIHPNGLVGLQMTEPGDAGRLRWVEGAANRQAPRRIMFFCLCVDLRRFLLDTCEI